MSSIVYLVELPPLYHFFYGFASSFFAPMKEKKERCCDSERGKCTIYDADNHDEGKPKNRLSSKGN